MKFRIFAGLALSALMYIIAVPASYADSTPSPSPSSTPLTAIEQYKLDVGLYKTLVSSREQVRKEITKEFMTKVAAANSLAKSAMRTAKTADAKSTILAQQKTAVAFAAAARDIAISNMGPAPFEPIKPKKLEIAKPSKPESGKSPESTSAKKSKPPKPNPTSSS